MQSAPTVSATPVLDLIEPIPGKWKFPVQSVIVGFLIGIVGVVLLGLHEVPWPHALRHVGSVFRVARLSVEYWDRQFLLGGLISVWGLAGLAILLHELGHFFVGRLVGFRLHSLQVGPLRISFEFGNLRVRFVSSAGLGGFAAMHIRSCSRLRGKLAKFVAAGPGVNLVCAMVALLLVQFPQAMPNFPMWSTAALFGIISLFFCVMSLLPVRVKGGYFTDGTRLLLLLRPSLETRRWYAIMGIGMQQQAGRRAREWNRRWLALASSNPDSSRDSLLGAFIAYAAASDRKDEPTAAACLERCLRSLPPARVPFRDVISNEAGIFQAWFRRDAEKARGWFAQVRKPAQLNPMLRIRAEVARSFVQGEFEAAYASWARGLSMIEGFRDTVQREMVGQSWLEWKQEMAERQTAAENAVPVHP
jgi:hypothetical protein